MGACDDSTMSNFSKAIREMECTFCRHTPCQESGTPPFGMNPNDVVKLDGSWAAFAQGEAERATHVVDKEEVHKESHNEEMERTSLHRLKKDFKELKVRYE